ncbi:CoA pyrophosphatase [Kyrpidia sp.]|uniref:NUDIX hydrolase n=1 Tax=Kyrpidia sp. TaxID=2073077 RepID=UPI00258A3A54|nr:CoA pyrophosphatase [Kyrpidia sp.]MCL6575207.1 CoA pyrophosphatase [Kyrpidia sp.]
METDALENFLKERKPRILGSEGMVQAAVALPLLEGDGGWQLVFEVRSHRLRRQPGEICFPGGQVEPGEDPAMTAIREMGEELGLPENRIKVLGPLDILVNPWRTIVYPYVCRIDPEPLRPNPDEVEEVFCVPVDYFLRHPPEVHHVHLDVHPEETFPFHRIPGGRNYPWTRGQTPEYFYEYKGKVIWGLTARILKHFLDLTTTGKSR